MKTLNINAKVRIKLTARGIDILKRKHDELRLLCPLLGEFTPPETDKDGYCEMPLYEIMSKFGEDLNMGNTDLPFENKIQIDDAKFEKD